MTKLSVNVNKIATLRNARGGNMPNVLKVTLDCEAFGAEGITVHPRPDERHIRYADVYELLDLGIGKCRMCVAAKEDYVEDTGRPVVVATKFPSIAKKYYMSTNREIEVIKLYGSIELAPLLNMSDVIVDIVETGTTLRENRLKVFEEIFPVSARLIANKASYKFKEKEIATIVGKLKEVTL